MKSDRPNRNWFWAVLCVCCIFIGILPYMPWLAAGFLPRIQAIQPWLLAIIVFAIIAALIRRRWLPSGITAALLLVGILPLVHFSGAAPNGSNGNHELKVFSFNAGRAQADPLQLAQAIREADPDVLVLVETSEPLIASIGKLNALEVLSHRSGTVPTGGDRDTVVFSRYPMTERQEEISAQKTGWYGFPVVDIASPSGVFSVVGVHVYPPLDDAERWEHGLDQLNRWARQQGMQPVILAGDFNATRTHPQFRRLAADMSAENTMWPLNTWPADRQYPPIMGIDRVLARGMSVLDARSIKIAGSDHLALSVTVRSSL
ncbi:endonuclease/exonuclease/phosphatase family protein [Glutamicibacter uratoxydans]|nr:endonuclease/exonuclease/phosphatase family protein [Glutamicibacter uratoxydans]